MVHTSWSDGMTFTNNFCRTERCNSHQMPPYSNVYINWKSEMSWSTVPSSIGLRSCWNRSSSHWGQKCTYPLACCSLVCTVKSSLSTLGRGSQASRPARRMWWECWFGWHRHAVRERSRESGERNKVQFTHTYSRFIEECRKRDSGSYRTLLVKIVSANKIVGTSI